MLKRKASDEPKKPSPLKQQKLFNYVQVQVALKDDKKSDASGSGSNNVGSKESENGLLNYLTEKSWKLELSGEFKKPYFKEIEKFLLKQWAIEDEKKQKMVFPPRHLIFNAFNLVPLDKVQHGTGILCSIVMHSWRERFRLPYPYFQQIKIKVVVLGQDPYHDNGQAHGLCFSVPRGITVPPSLKNIFKELSEDITDFRIPEHGNLERWARQGVFLLNATLTVQPHQANSHSAIGWQTFTDAVISLISRDCAGVVFLLWGGFAQKKAKLIDEKRHQIIQTAHPSPLSAGKFFGCRCFSKANEALVKFGKTPVDWRLD